MQATKLPQWVRAIGSLIAKRFDVSGEPLPLEMDLVLRLMSDDRNEERTVGEESKGPPDRRQPSRRARER
jgi:hypothetical protein